MLKNRLLRKLKKIFAVQRKLGGKLIKIKETIVKDPTLRSWIGGSRGLNKTAHTHSGEIETTLIFKEAINDN